MLKQNLEIPLACGTPYAPITVRSPQHVETIFLDFGHRSPSINLQACLTPDEIRALITNLNLALENCKVGIREPDGSFPIGADQFRAIVEGQAA